MVDELIFVHVSIIDELCHHAAKELKSKTNDKDGDKAGERCVPVSSDRCSFPNQNAVEDEIAEAELHRSYRHEEQIIHKAPKVNLSVHEVVYD